MVKVIVVNPDLRAKLYRELSLLELPRKIHIHDLFLEAPIKFSVIKKRFNIDNVIVAKKEHIIIESPNVTYVNKELELIIEPLDVIYVNTEFELLSEFSELPF